MKVPNIVLDFLKTIVLGSRLWTSTTFCYLI